MITRVDSKAARDDRQRLVLRDKPRDAPSMEGWRIEVRVELAGETEIAIETDPRPQQRLIGLRIAPFIVGGAPLEQLNDRVAWAGVDAPRETIYVSRALSDEEANTLRRLMAEECARERRQEDIDTALLLAGEKIAEAAMFGYSETTQADVDRARERVRKIRYEAEREGLAVPGQFLDPVNSSYPSARISGADWRWPEAKREFPTLPSNAYEGERIGRPERGEPTISVVSWDCYSCGARYLRDCYAHFDATCRTRHRVRCGQCGTEYELEPKPPRG